MSKHGDARLGTFNDNYDSIKLIETVKKIFSHQDTTYGTPGSEIIVWDEDADTAMNEAVEKQDKHNKKE